VVDELYRSRESERSARVDAQLLERVDRLTERLGAALDGQAGVDRSGDSAA
jgi:hypothetical protein